MLSKFILSPGQLALAGLLTMLSIGDGQADLTDDANQISKGPVAAPMRSITSFSGALRCMDNQLSTYGVRDVSMLVEELTDQTRKVSAGTKDMLISAISDMTKRSRAIRLIAYGQDSGNLINFLQAAEKKGAYAQIPQYDIRGSISQFDENIATKANSLGFSFLGMVNIGGSSAGAASVLGIDLTVLNTADLSVIPGVTSRNGVLIMKDGTDVNGRGEAQFNKFGINFSTSFGKNEGNTQAVRNLIELAAIELVGKLTKIPYWTCLGADPKSAPVMEEMGDWFYAMSGSESELISYFQHQLGIRGFYRGPTNGTGSLEFAQGISDLRVALGLQANYDIDQELFTAYLNADLAKIKPPLRAPVVKEVSKTALPIDLEINPGKQGKFERGEAINLTIKPSRDAYVYCFLLDETQKVQRFFPNRFYRSALISPTEPLTVPGKMRFQLAASDAGNTETIACYATPGDIQANLTAPWNAPDFEPIGNASLDQLKAAVSAASPAGMNETRFSIDVR